MPPGRSEDSELDDALFGGLPQTVPDPVERRSAVDEIDGAALDVVLFGDDERHDAVAVLTTASPRAARRPARERGARLVSGVVAMLLVVGIGGAAYAVFGRGDAGTRRAPTVEVRSAQVTGTTAVPSTTTATTLAPVTTVAPTTTAAPPTTARGSAGTTPSPPVATEPPFVLPPPTDPPTTAPPTAPPTTPTTAPPTTTRPPPPTTTTRPPPPTTTTTTIKLARSR